MFKSAKLISSILFCELIGLAATPFTIATIPTWYQTLNKPFFSPPNWIFGPVWTLLYLLMGISFYLVWQKGFENKTTKFALGVFLLQLFLNFLWSIFFFGLHSPFLAMVDIIFLWLAIIVAILKFRKISQPAGLLLIPYLIWVSFATVLNFSILVLN